MLAVTAEGELGSGKLADWDLGSPHTLHPPASVRSAVVSMRNTSEADCGHKGRQYK